MMPSMNNIDYEQIDEMLRPIIKILNENGYRTKFCCQGHGDRDPMYIMFHEELDDSKILPLLQLVDSQYALWVKGESPIQKGCQIKLQKWPRYVRGELHTNWILDMNGRALLEKNRENIMNKLYKVLEKHFKKPFRIKGE